MLREALRHRRIEDRAAGGKQRRRAIHRFCHITNHLHVFLPHLNLHRCRQVVTINHEFAAQLENAITDHRAGGEQIPDLLCIQPHLAGEGQRFGHCNVVDRHHVIGGEFHPRAVAVGTNMMGYSPVIGSQVRFVLLGGTEIGAETLLRWYVLHVLLFPFVTVIFLAIHFWRVRKDGGISGPL